MRHTILLLSALLASPFARAQQAGDLDPWFNSGDLGYARGDGAGAVIYPVAVQPDGKVLLGGPFLSFNYVTRQRIARVNADGTLDTGFDPGYGADSWVLAIAVQPDGRILIGGSFTYYDGQPTNRIVRLNADGSRDAGFNVGTGVDGTVRSIVVQPDGRILLGGEFDTYNGVPAMGLARLNVDGSLDTGFNTGDGITGSVKAVALQDDGRILVGGGLGTYDSTDCPNIIRLTESGALDGTFDPGTGPDGDVNRIVVQPDQHVLFAGMFSNFNGSAHEPVVRLDPNGALDPSFSPPELSTTWLTGLGLRPDGSIMVSGQLYQIDGQPFPSVARLNADGSLDAAFNTGSGAASLVRDLAVYPDGKTIVTGDFSFFNGYAQGYVARLNDAGGVDPTFNTQTAMNGNVNRTVIDTEGRIIAVGGFDGYNGLMHQGIVRMLADGSADPELETSGLEVNGALRDVLLQPDGRIVITGFAMDYGSESGTIMRLNADGSYDPSFTPDNASIYSMALQPDGKIIVGGIFLTYAGVPRNRVARLNADGTLDTSFDPGGGPDGVVNRIVVQPDGQILIAGGFNNVNGIALRRIARLNTDGSVDQGFDVGTGPNDFVADIALQPDGKILLAGGFVTFNGVQARGLVRLHPDGSVDTSFDTSPAADDDVASVGIDPLGRVLVGGNFTTWHGTTRNGMARLNADGSLDTSLDPGAGFDGLPLTFSFQADEMIVVGGSFTSYNGTGRNRILRVFGALSTGVPASDQQPTVEAWPVPAGHAVRVRLSDGSAVIQEVRVLDGTGRRQPATIASGARTHEVLLDISRCAAGSYYAVVIGQDGATHRTAFVKAE